MSGNHRSVNAYASNQDMLYNGLEMASTMEAASSTQAPSRPELGMVDCGATVLLRP